MSCTVNQLIAKCEQAVREKWQYVYGAKGTVLSRVQIDALRKLYGSNCVWASDSNKTGRICCDCSGLISASTGIVRGSAQYKSTALECYPISQRKSSMRGWAVWLPGHIGVYDGDGGYYAMDGSDRNAVHYPLSKNKFTHILKLCDVDYGAGVSAGKVPAAIASGGVYNSEIHVDYAVMLEGGKTLPFVRDLSDYAGIRGEKIYGIAAKVSAGTLDYRITTVNGIQYELVHGCDWKDYENGFAGDGKNPVATVEMYLHSPEGDKYIYYRVSPVNGEYYPYQRDTDKSSSMDGYAGESGASIDRLQIYIK